MRSLKVEILVLSGVSLLMTFGSIADAAGPAQADFDICNREAYARAASPSAAPATGGDTATNPRTPVSPSAAPATETPATPSAAPTTGTGAGASSASDDLSRGMTAAGEADPAFRHAYIECMKRRGF